MMPAFRRSWAWPRELKNAGVLGMNARNLNFVLKLNRRELYPRVDDKSITKGFCESKNIPVPGTLGIVEKFGDIRYFIQIIGEQTDFVIKPACGAGGRGVFVVAEHDGKTFITPSGEKHSIQDLHHHLSTT